MTHNKSLTLPSQVGHIKRLQQGVDDIREGKLPPRLLQCVTSSLPTSTAPPQTTTTTATSSVVTTAAVKTVASTSKIC